MLKITMKPHLWRVWSAGCSCRHLRPLCRFLQNCGRIFQPAGRTGADWEKIRLSQEIPEPAAASLMENTASLCVRTALKHTHTRTHTHSRVTHTHSRGTHTSHTHTHLSRENPPFPTSVIHTVGSADALARKIPWGISRLLVFQACRKSPSVLNTSTLGTLSPLCQD